jgi:hypothetical protein
MKLANFRKQIVLGVLACATVFSAANARAEIVLYDKDGWSVKTDGLAQGFFMHTSGDAAPNGTTPFVKFDFLDTGPANADGSFQSTRFRSGWTGGRFNWRITRQMSETIKVSAFLGIAYSISSQNAPAKTNNMWDIRNGFLEINAPWGDLVVGRHVGLYTLGSIISTINNTSAALGLGNTCGTNGDGLSCYTSGYGVKFPGFWAGVVYTTPSIGGLKLKVAAYDPVAIGANINGQNADNMERPVSQLWAKTPLPHFQALALFETAIGGLQLKPFFNGFTQQVGRTVANEDRTLTTWGAGLGLDVVFGGLKVGAGGSTENGTALYLPLQGAGETVDGNGNLRKGSSVYVHGMYTLGNVDIGAGWGQATLDRTDFDVMNRININRLQRNLHASVIYHYGPLAFVGELNLLDHQYHFGNQQKVTVFNLGANFAY